MEYELIRSDRKTVSLEVTKDGHVRVRAPRRLPQAQIDRFVAEHRQWLQEALRRQQARQEAHPEPDAQEICRLLQLPVTQKGGSFCQTDGRSLHRHYHHRRKNPFRILQSQKPAVFFLAAHAVSGRGH